MKDHVTFYEQVDLRLEMSGLRSTEKSSESVGFYSPHRTVLNAIYIGCLPVSAAPTTDEARVQ